jgi:hypothetical protein
VTLNKRIYIEFTVLDVSKLLWFDFHYCVIAKCCGMNAWMLFTDTDSLCYHLITDDVYSDMLEKRHLLDSSNYPRKHPLYSAEKHDSYRQNEGRVQRHTPVGIHRASFENVQSVHVR